MKEDNDLEQGIRYHFLKKKLEEVRAIEKSLPPVKEDTLIIRFWKPLAIAAGILLVITFAFLINRPDSPDQLFAKNFEPYPNVFEPSERSAEAPDLRSAAFSMYEQKNYEGAAASFKELLSQKTEPEILFLLGNANMALGKFDEAKENLRTVIDNYDQLDEQAKWYLGLCFLKTGDRQSAEKLWKEINKHPIPND